jgi:hypothetical protein
MTLFTNQSGKLKEVKKNLKNERFTEPIKTPEIKRFFFR